MHHLNYRDVDVDVAVAVDIDDVVVALVAAAVAGGGSGGGLSSRFFINIIHFATITNHQLRLSATDLPSTIHWLPRI